MSEFTSIGLYLLRCEKIERAGVSSLENKIERVASMTILDDSFAMIRSNPAKAYVMLMRAGMDQPANKPESIGKTAFFSRIAGYALMYAMQDEGIFTRIMDINEKPVV